MHLCELPLRQRNHFAALVCDLPSWQPDGFATGTALTSVSLGFVKFLLHGFGNRNFRGGPGVKAGVSRGKPGRVRGSGSLPTK
jgi:hypothetical protein